MRSTKRTRYILGATVIVMLLALLWWYFFLRAKGTTLQEEDARRGAGLELEPFGGPAGSTYENIVSSFGTPVTDTSARESKDAPTSRLMQISKTPTAGMGFVGAASSELWLVERSSGYVLEADPKTGALSRLTNTTLPQTYEALIGTSGTILLQRLEDGRIVTTLGEISTSSSALRETRLPDGIRALALSPKGGEFFYIVGESGSAVGIREKNDRSKETRLFSSAVSNWQATWLSDGHIVITQLPSEGASGFSYELKDGLLPLVRNAVGLTVLPRAFSSALLWGESRGGLQLYAKTATTSAMLLPVRTTADKCVWAPGSALIAYCAVPQRPAPPDYLDLRARGEVHTADAWWRVDVRANSAELLFSPGSTELDVERPLIDAAGQYIAFLNGRDKSLWLLRISEN